MKNVKNVIPDWFDLSSYRRVQSWGDWAYETWVRANFYQQLLPNGQRSFFTQADPDGTNFRCHYLAPIPIGLEHFQAFLANNSHFREHFSDQSRFFLENICANTDTVLAHDSAQNELISFFSDLPDQIPKKTVLDYIDHWLELYRPTPLNLMHSDKSIINGIKKVLKNHRREAKELRLLATDLAHNTGKWRDNYIWRDGKLLALFDLLYHREAFGRPSYEDIGQALWRSEYDVDLVARIKRVGLPLMAQFFSIETAIALYAEQERLSTLSPSEADK